MKQFFLLTIIIHKIKSKQNKNQIDNCLLLKKKSNSFQQNIQKKKNQSYLGAGFLQ